MTNKLITAYIDNDFDPFTSKEHVKEFFGGYFELEGVAKVRGKNSSGLEVDPEYGFEEENTQVQVVTVEYTVTEEYAVSLKPSTQEEQDNGNSEDGTESGSSEPEGDSGLDEGVEPPSDSTSEDPSEGTGKV